MANDIAQWLEDLGFVQYTEAFVENGVDFDLLSEITNDDLKDLGVSRLADRKRLLKAIAAFADVDAPAGASVVSCKRRSRSTSFRANIPPRRG